MFYGVTGNSTERKSTSVKSNESAKHCQTLSFQLGSGHESKWMSEKDFYRMIDHINIIHLEHFTIKYSLVKELYFDYQAMNRQLCAMKHATLWSDPLSYTFSVNVATFSLYTIW